MEKIKADEILINALDYPEPARPEFLLLNQKKSDWSKGLFLKWLQEAVLEFDRSIKALRKPVTIDVNGKKVEITEDIVVELRLAVELAHRVGVEQKSYTSIELMAFFNRALYFIFDEFQLQSGLKKPLWLFEETTGNTNQAKYIFYQYEVFSNIDLFDFFTYRNVIRDLSLNVRNVEELRRILKPIFEGCVKIVELYNEKIQPVEERSIDNEMKVIFKDRQIAFDEKAFDFVVLMHHPYNQFRSFYAKNYSNRAL